MKKLSIYALFLAGLTFSLVSCDEETDPLEAPSLVGPTTTANVSKGGNPVEIIFSANTPEGYGSASVTASNGTAVITSEPADAAITGQVKVTFTSGNTAGAASVTLEITDAKDQKDEATAVVNVLETDAPAITSPGNQSVQVEDALVIDVTVATAAGYASASLETVGGTATISSAPAVDALTGTISINFTAGATAGAASVKLTVTDSEGETAETTIVINVSASPVPSISGIPASASVIAGQTLGPVPATVTMVDVPGTFTITKNGAAYGSAVNLTTNGQVVNFSYTPSFDEIGSAITFVFTATDSDGDVTSATHVLSVTAPDFETVVVSSNIVANTTWTKDKIYELGARIIVEPGVTLTIEAGTVIKAQPGAEANATALVIAKGADIIAEGTASAPIIFTSTQDEIIPGQIVSPNLLKSDDGLWGGLIVLGNGLVSVSNNSGIGQIEGIPGDVTLAQYGGTDATDNSGILKYISIRHSGTVLTAGNEINGLTLGGVGSGTVVDYIEVVGNKDDGVEIFGGSVNLNHVIITENEDDGLDIDQAYTGTVTNLIVISGSLSDHNLEIDGPEGSMLGRFTLNNATLKGYAGNLNEIGDFRSVATGTISNMYMFGFENIIAATGATGAGDLSISSGTLVDANNMVFNNLQITLSATSTKDLSFPNATVRASVTEVAAGAATVGADKTKFANWTYVGADGTLAGL